MLDKAIVDELVKVVSNSSDKSKICKALIKLRAELVTDKEGIQLFLSCDGLPPLIRLISKPYEKILEASLSILANCCTLKECCKQAISHGIVPPLLTILRSLPNSSVQCKACRLIGNLARESNEKLCNLAKGIGVAISAVMDDNNDVSTLIMATRAVRLLWNEMPFFEEFIRSDGIKKIIGIMVKHAKVDEKHISQSITEKFPNEKARVQFMEEHIHFMESINSRVFDHEILKKDKPVEDVFKMPAEKSMQMELFSSIFRCLQVVTVGLSLRVIYDFYDDQRGCNCVVYFAKANSPFREQALKILSNLARFQNSNEILCNADAITTACNLITNQNLDPGPPLTESEERHCVNIICFLSRDACNRAKIRMSGAFKRLLEIAKDTKCDSVLSTILIGLQSFKYDNVSIEVMIKMGLVKVLVERLNINTKDLSENHVKRSRSKSPDENDDGAEENVTMDKKSKRMKVEYSPFIYIPTSPPSTVNNSYPSSPCSSSGLSPKTTPPRNFDNNDEDGCSEYSPVCSDIEDNEDENPETKTSTKDNAQLDSKDTLTKDPSIDNDFENILPSEEEEEDGIEKEKELNPMDAIEKKKNIQLIINILCAVSYRVKLAWDLCTTDTLDSLIRTCRVAFKRNTENSQWEEQGAPLILSNIVSETINFTRIIKQDFIFKIYKLTTSEKDHKNCATCTDLQLVGNGLLSTLKSVADTGYGRGELAHGLLKGEKSLQKQISVITTYIVGNPKNLHWLLVECGGLYIVMDIILSNDKELRNEAVSGFTALSKVLFISVTQYDETKIKQNFKYNPIGKIEQNDDNNSATVTFIAGQSDDDTNDRIVFSEKILIEFSDVFDSMLKSDFRESKSREIHLKNQTKHGIKYFLDSLNQMYKNEVLHVPACDQIAAVLEAHDMCKIYMLTELEKEIFNMILFMLNETTVLNIFQFAIANQKQELIEVAISYYLCANIKDELKVKMYRDADNAKYYKEWNQMMLDIVVHSCENLMTNN